MKKFFTSWLHMLSQYTLQSFCLGLPLRTSLLKMFILVCQLHESVQKISESKSERNEGMTLYGARDPKIPHVTDS